MSPYSWFAAERIGALIPDAQWRPVFAGGLFRANGRGTWGLGPRREAGIADCERRAELHGLGPIKWPDPWPTNDVLVARAMAFAAGEGRLQQFALAAMRAAFKEGGDLGDPAVVEAVASGLGWEAGRVSRAVEQPEIKQAVRRLHEEAMSLGVFGVPSTVVADEVLWGDDRLEEAAAAAVRHRQEPEVRPSDSAG